MSRAVVSERSVGTSNGARASRSTPSPAAIEDAAMAAAM